MIYAHRVHRMYSTPEISAQDTSSKSGTASQSNCVSQQTAQQYNIHEYSKVKLWGKNLSVVVLQNSSFPYLAVSFKSLIQF